MRLSKVWVIALAFVIVTTLASASEQGRFERSLQVSGAADLEVLTRSGDNTIRSGSGGTISIIGHIHVGDRWFTGGRKEEVAEIEKNPPVQQSGNHVRIDYVNQQNISIDYE